MAHKKELKLRCVDTLAAVNTIVLYLLQSEPPSKASSILAAHNALLPAPPVNRTHPQEPPAYRVACSASPPGNRVTLPSLQHESHVAHHANSISTSNTSSKQSHTPRSLVYRVMYNASPPVHTAAHSAYPPASRAYRVQPATSSIHHVRHTPFMNE